MWRFAAQPTDGATSPVTRSITDRHFTTRVVWLRTTLTTLRTKLKTQLSAWKLRHHRNQPPSTRNYFRHHRPDGRLPHFPFTPVQTPQIFLLLGLDRLGRSGPPPPLPSAIPVRLFEGTASGTNGPRKYRISKSISIAHPDRRAGITTHVRTSPVFLSSLSASLCWKWSWHLRHGFAIVILSPGFPAGLHGHSAQDARRPLPSRFPYFLKPPFDATVFL